MTYEEAKALAIMMICIRCDIGRKYPNCGEYKCKEALDLICDALDKQKNPKKPTQDLRKGIECYCPVCGAYVGWRDAMADDLMNFCGDCGQAIDWETSDRIADKQ